MNQVSRGTLVITVGVILPVLIYFITEDFTINLDSLGRVTGLAGLSALSINIILSARLKIFDKLFHGLDKMYKVHHILGCVTLLLILAHFNFIILKLSLGSLQVGYDFIMGFGGWYRVSAKIGLLLLLFGMITVLYLKVSYKWFILIHRIMAVAIFFGGYHALFVPKNSIITNPILFIYMVSLGGFAILVFIYRSIFHKPLNKTFIYKITKINLLGTVTEIYMKPVNRALQHYAGQYAFISFHSKLVTDEVHPFSISSGSDSTELRFSVKQLGDFTSTLPKLTEGDTVTLEGPFGKFTPTKIGGDHQVWIAGGIGITPFLSMIQSVDPKLSVDLYYCTPNKQEAIYLSELVSYIQNKNIRVYSICEDTFGFLKAQQIANLTNSSKILICGPPPMMNNLKKQFIEIGIKKYSIYFEEFTIS